jgi:yecA family protein
MMLNAQDLFVIDSLLRTYKSMPLVGAHGFLAANLCLPEPKNIETLLPYLFGGQLPPFQYDEQNTLTNLLAVLQASVEDQLNNQGDAFSPLDFLEKADEVEQEVVTDALALWCLGFIHGLRVEADYWEARERLDPAFAVLLILAGKDDKDDQAKNQLGARVFEIYTSSSQAPV